MLLKIFVQANAGKVRRKLSELSDCNNEINELRKEQVEVARII